MLMLMFMTLAAGQPMTVTTEDGDQLAADEVFILQLDEDGNVEQGPSLEAVIESNFAWDDTDWEAGVGAMAAFHRELGESVIQVEADVGHILGTEDGARTCLCPQSCSSGECEFQVEVDFLFSASLQCSGTCEADPCTTEATDAGGSEGQTQPGEGPTETEDGGIGGGIEAPAATCEGECEEDKISTTDANYSSEVLRILQLWSGAGRGPNASEPCD